MKRKNAASLILALAVLFYIFTGVSSEITGSIVMQPVHPVPVSSNDFLIGAMDNAWDFNFSHREELGLNIWHKYCGTEVINGKTYPTGWTQNSVAPNDRLVANKDENIGDIQSQLSKIKQQNMKALLSRPKIEYLCYGQRSDYQCEDSALVDTNYYFYTFQSPGHVGTDEQDFSQYGNGEYVRHCSTGNRSTGSSNFAGIVVSRLRTNSEQCNGENEGYKSDTQCVWYVKPRIRIDSTIAHNSGNTLVCNIKVIAQDSFTVLKSVDIRAGNFINPVNGNYSGQYLDEFYNLASTDSLKIYGSWLGTDKHSKWVYKSRGSRNPEWAGVDTVGDNHADIQVYWYGNCDMWIDYVRVDNDVAHNLFGTGETHNLYDKWLQWEAEIACTTAGGSEPVGWQFYIELFQFNQIPCIAYVNRKLDSLTMLSSGRHFNVIADQLTFYDYHMQWDERGKITTPARVAKTYFERTGSKQVFIGDPYALNAIAPGCIAGNNPQYSRIPNTLGPYSQPDRILANAVAPTDYDAWLQSIFDTTCNWYEGGVFREWDDHLCCPSQLKGVFMYLMKQGHRISKQCEIPFYAMLQDDQWVSPGEVEREPTNEELNVMTNIAISYGARGIEYWWYGGRDRGSCNYTYGFTDENNNPRMTNVYGQPKWDSVKAMIRRLKTWGPTLMSFNNADRNSYIYRFESERNELTQNSYLADVISYVRDTGVQPCQTERPESTYTGPTNPTLRYECQDNRYLQVATFKTGPTDIDQYFMIVNKRCSPLHPSDHNDGERYIRVRFHPNSEYFPTYTNWKITDLGTNMDVVTFSKSSTGLLDLGWYNPAEGKLYKISPIN